MTVEEALDEIERQTRREWLVGYVSQEEVIKGRKVSVKAKPIYVIASRPWQKEALKWAKEAQGWIRGLLAEMKLLVPPSKPLPKSPCERKLASAVRGWLRG